MQLRLKLDTITQGADWLNHPDVIRLREMHGLSKVRTQIVGPRASFEGKAYGYQGVVRMPSNARHPILWLLTYLHELAHVLDDQDRLRIFEEKRGRKALRTGPDLRWLNSIDTPHGRRWTEAFTALVATGVKLGLFPGNEAAALAHARSGRARTATVQLDFDADPRVRAETVIPAGLRATTVAASAFRPGDAVRFDSGERRHGKLQGTVVKVNRKTCTVETGTGKWRVSFQLLEKAPK